MYLNTGLALKAQTGKLPEMSSAEPELEEFMLSSRTGAVQPRLLNLQNRNILTFLLMTMEVETLG